MHLKALGKSLATIESLNSKTPKLKPEIKEALDKIEKLMKDHEIYEVRIC